MIGLGVAPIFTSHDPDDPDNLDPVMFFEFDNAAMVVQMETLRQVPRMLMHKVQIMWRP